MNDSGKMSECILTSYCSGPKPNYKLAALGTDYSTASNYDMRRSKGHHFARTRPRLGVWVEGFGRWRCVLGHTPAGIRSLLPPLLPLRMCSEPLLNLIDTAAREQ
jgi:hypothetical protein